MNVSISALVEQVKALPRWPEISQLVKKEGLKEEDIAHFILSVINLNAPGLVNPIANVFFLLPLLPNRGKELLANEELMDSFCWELLRFSSRTFIVPASSKNSSESGNTVIINSSNDESYRVNGNTLLFTHLPVVMRDEKYWAEPNLFKAGRFRFNSFSNNVNEEEQSQNVEKRDNEPLPTLVFGCPLGRLFNSDEHQNNRRCPFSLLGQPFLKAFVKMLLKSFRWRLDHNSRNKLEQMIVSSDSNSKDILVVDYSPHNLTGGYTREADQIPDTNFARFSAFEEINNLEEI